MLSLPGALVIHNRHFVHCSWGLIKAGGSGGCVEPKSYIESSREEILLLHCPDRGSVSLLMCGDMSAHHHNDGDPL